MKRRVYFPMSCEILHIGHVLAIREAKKYGNVIIGLLSDEVIEEYKGHKPIMTYKHRAELLISLMETHSVLRQKTLKPDPNLLKELNIRYIASGDGFEPEEIEAAEEAGVSTLDIRLPNEKEGEKKYSTTNIKNKVIKQWQKNCF